MIREQETFYNDQINMYVAQRLNFVKKITNALPTVGILRVVKTKMFIVKPI